LGPVWLPIAFGKAGSEGPAFFAGYQEKRVCRKADRNAVDNLGIVNRSKREAGQGATATGVAG